ncbi:MAG TPA: phosphoribosylamine--glycine ligase [Ktedonobacterales bacterium]|nr:phosphoribosylamine--glycine ligase [Ktedonobacterales bacterium]
MKILIIGGGAREHALAWKLAQSRHQPALYVAPGNPGVARAQPHAAVPTPPATCVALAADDLEGLAAFARAEAIDLAVVGPEAPLTLGLADRLRAAGVRVCGPGQAGARLEGSKSFAKDLMARAGIPTARHASFSDGAAARAYVERHGAPVVIKTDGLAAGKGVTVAHTLPDALDALEQAMERRAFGDAGATVVIEDYLDGDELSVMAFVADGTYRLLLPSQDHKQIFDGDRGPNTGGMGAFAPVPWAGDELLGLVRERIFTPLLAELARAGIAYRGVLYAGLMVTAAGPHVIEFNARLGDPETQVTLPLLATDLLDVCLAVSDGTLERIALAHRPGAAVGVVLASAGYPGPTAPSQPITLEVDAMPAGTLVFHAGTREEGGRLLTAGGRVLTLVGQGADLAAARAAAYAAVRHARFAGMHARGDIGLRPRRVG